MRVRLPLAVLTPLLLAGPAGAGPIEWSIRADVDPARRGTEFYLGQFNHWRPDGATEVLHA